MELVDNIINKCAYSSQSRLVRRIFVKLDDW